MSTFVLEAGRTVRLSAKSFKVHLAPSGGMPSLELTTRGNIRAYELRPNMWLVQMAAADVRVTESGSDPESGRDSSPEEAALGVTTKDGAALGPAAHLGLTIETEPSSGFDAETVKISPQDLAGTSRRELLTLRMTSQATEIGLSTASRESTSMSSEASAMLAHTRRFRAGLEGVNGDHGISVLLDDSASMSCWFDSGRIGDIVEAFYGVSQALDTIDDFHVILGAVPISHGNEPRRALEDAWAATGHRTGFDAGALAPRSPSAVTFVVTDAPPADLEHLENRHERGDLRHLVLLMEPDAYAACAVQTSVPVTVWAPGTIPDENLVRSLLSNSSDASNHRHERVGS